MSEKATQPLLSVRHLKVHFQVKAPHFWPWHAKKTLRAVDDISFDLYAGETLSIVGESGCGKSTLSRALVNLHPVTAGEIVWMGKNLCAATKQDWLNVRRDIQMIFQDPLGSLNPRMTVAQIIAEPLHIHHPTLSTDEVIRQVKAMMNQVGLREEMINRYPHEFSGGQCQRIGIARALILKPKMIICDEPVSALDVSIQAQIINLLKELQKKMGLALLFIAHNLAVVKHVSDRILVMYLGRSMELADKHALYRQPSHPYTRALLSAIPSPDPRQERKKIIQHLHGDLPSPINPPSGCVFHPRCPQAEARCATETVMLRRISQQTETACLLEK